MRPPKPKYPRLGATQDEINGYHRAERTCLEWENKIMRKAINEARARCDRDALALAILDAALEEIGR